MGDGVRISAAQPRLGPLAERPFLILFFGRTVSMMGSAIAPLALAFAVIHLTGSPSDLGLVLAASFVPQVIFLLVGGVWADRLPRHLVMVTSDVVGAAAQATAAVLLLLGQAQVWHIVVLAAVRGTASAFFVPASSAVVPQTVPQQMLQQANALLGLSRNATGILGAAGGGVLVAAVGPGWALAGDAATYLLGACIVAFLRLPAAPVASRQKFVRELAEGWQEVRSRTWLWTIVTQFTFINAFSWAAFFVLGPFVADGQLGGPAVWGLILMAQACGMLAGGFLALRFRPRRPLFAGNLAILLIALPLGALALPAGVVLIAIAAFIAGAGVEFFEVLWATTLHERIPEAKLSRVSSYDWLGSYVLVPVGTIAIGPLAGAVGLSDTLWLAAGVVIAATTAVLSVSDVRRVTRLATPEPPAAEAPTQALAA
jgi:MFS family permease